MIDFGIIAAGDGNRIKEEGSLVPKPLVEIDGAPMIGRLISLMESCGAKSVNIIVNSDMPEVWQYLQNIVPTLSTELRLVSKKTPSSMHSFMELLNVMKPEGRFVVTTVDTIFREEDFRNYVKAFENSSKEVDGLMGVTTYIDDEKPLYVETDSKGRITAYKDTAPQHPVEGTPVYISAGIYGLIPSALPVLDKCISEGKNRMRNFQRQLVETGLNLRAYNLGKVLDVDHICDIEKANSFLSENIK